MKEKRYIAIYGGTELTQHQSEFVGELSYQLLSRPDVVLVVGGFHYSKNDPQAISTDVSALAGAKRFAKDRNVKLENCLETWLPDPEKDRKAEKIVRFKEGKVKELKGESAQARRFSIVRDVNTIITIKGKKHTAMILDFALTINKPAFPLPFTGGDSLYYWKGNREKIKGWFELSRSFIDELENTDIEKLGPAQRDELIQKIITAVDTALIGENKNDLDYKKSQEEWEAPKKDILLNVEVIEKKARPLSLFLSYSHKDKELKDQLDKHLTALKRSKKISIWNDKEIEGGGKWNDIIKTQIKEADIILFLISPDFIASPYIENVEMKLAMEKHEESKIRIIPVFLRKVDIRDLPISQFQGYPPDARPITSFSEREQDEAFYQVAVGLREDIEKWAIKS